MGFGLFDDSDYAGESAAASPRQQAESRMYDKRSEEKRIDERRMMDARMSDARMMQEKEYAKEKAKAEPKFEMERSRSSFQFAYMMDLGDMEKKEEDKKEKKKKEVFFDSAGMRGNNSTKFSLFYLFYSKDTIPKARRLALMTTNLLLKGIPNADALADAMIEKRVRKDDVVVQSGAPSEYFYLIAEGQVEILGKQSPFDMTDEVLT